MQAEHLTKVPERVAYFAHIEDEVLQAAGTLKCYSGHWYMRGDVVAPAFRGRGLQRALIEERIAYLGGRTVRAGIHPENIHSLRNYLDAGFVFEKHKAVPDGTLNIYRYR